MVKDKGGISAIVATVLIILITVAAVTIIWVAIIPVISDGLDVGDVRLTVSTQGGYTVYDKNDGFVSVQVSRGPFDTIMKNMNVIILFDDGNTYSEVVEAPLPNQKRVYSWDLSKYSGVPISVSVAPILVKNGNIEEGIASSYIEFSEGSVDEENLEDNPFGAGDCVTGAVRPCGSTDVGACEFGNENCVADDEHVPFWSGECLDEIVSDEEVCDAEKLDENCDGSKNENCDCNEGEIQDCGKVGACEGIQTCDINGVMGACDNLLIPGENVETCNGIDDDCNGIDDDGLIPPVCGTNDVGNCQFGSQTCTGIGGWDGTGLNCVGEITPEVAEDCTPGTGDEDCNGQTDCGDAACVGNAACVASATVNYCVWDYSGDCSDVIPADICSVASYDYSVGPIGTITIGGESNIESMELHLWRTCGLDFEVLVNGVVVGSITGTPSDCDCMVPSSQLPTTISVDGSAINPAWNFGSANTVQVRETFVGTFVYMSLDADVTYSYPL